MAEPKLSIGIDLGTTNCALAALDLADGAGAGSSPGTTWPIPQVVHPGEVKAQPLLPSFLYLPGEHELPKGALDLPWGKPPDVVGELAREQGSRVPIRLVSSAKSWLCHSGVDRRAPILPNGAPAEVPKVSPLAASARYLEHLRDAWDSEHPKARLEKQDVVITVPASFDEAARELTAEAAKAAHLPKITLLEEPQAALYAWLESQGDGWRRTLKLGDVILVCDVGGGTSDFSLIAVLEEQGNLVLHRIAVGDHLLLGGDNMDLALAYSVRSKLEAQKKSLDAWQFQVLVHASRVAKEALLNTPNLEVQPLAVPGRGSGLVGGTLRTELTRAELTAVLVDGFFPTVDSSARPVAARRVGLTQLGLPYAQDPGITRHLASFLGRQTQALHSIPGGAGLIKPGRTFVHPTSVLFNGGVMKAPMLRERVLQILDGWLSREGSPPVKPLEGSNLDLAVARGAAYYGRVRRGSGIRIRGGTARAYYVGVEASAPAVPGIAPPLKAVCVAPFGMEEGTDAELSTQELGVVVGEPVQFRFFSSSSRQSDGLGVLLERWGDELEEIAPIETALPPGEGAVVGQVVPVHLHAAVTEVGTLALSLVPTAGPRTAPWKLELDIRQRADA